MTITAITFLQERSKLLYLLVLACLLTLLISAGFFGPAQAADDPQASAQVPAQLAVCEPPADWGQTVRLKNPQKPTNQWTFTVSEPEMDVSLGFFYYQDYSKQGCPYDCSTGSCQTDEIGKGVTPLGNINVIDGKEGGNRGVKKVTGRLTQGSYQVVFTANGDPGSINIGLNIKLSALPTATPAPTDTPTPTAITPTEPPLPTPTQTELPPTDTPEPPLPTPTQTGSPPTDTPEPTATTPPPPENPTPTPTKKNPQPTKTEVKQTPPATLAPPTPLPGTTTPMVLIPVTGARIAVRDEGASANIWLLIPLGIGFFGLGIAFYGIANRLKQGN